MKNLFRLIAINYTLARFGLDQVFLSFHYLGALKFLSIINPFNWFRKDELTQAERLRLCIESLGPIFIKFGQMLATRRDLLPEDIIVELEKLLDQVPPFPLEQLSNNNLDCLSNKPFCHSMTKCSHRPQ
jgi:ubiquinone biosynthesis protein